MVEVYLRGVANVFEPDWDEEYDLPPLRGRYARDGYSASPKEPRTGSRRSARSPPAFRARAQAAKALVLPRLVEDGVEEVRLCHAPSLFSTLEHAAQRTRADRLGAEHPHARREAPVRRRDLEGRRLRSAATMSTITSSAASGPRAGAKRTSIPSVPPGRSNGLESSTTATSSPVSAAWRASSSASSDIAPRRSRHHPVGREPITFMPSTIRRRAMRASCPRAPDVSGSRSMRTVIRLRSGDPHHGVVRGPVAAPSSARATSSSGRTCAVPSCHSRPTFTRTRGFASMFLT